jgi:adenosylcobinamide amidohydrolase
VNVDVRIDRLVLDGIDLTHADRPRLQAAVETELGRLLAEQPALGVASGGAVPVVRGGNLRLGGPATELGGRIARAVHEGLAR